MSKIFAILVMVIGFFAIQMVVALTEEPEVFPIQPEIGCRYEGTEGLLTYTLPNPFDREITLGRLSPFDVNLTHLTVVLNGRLVEPEEHCTGEIIEVGGSVECSVDFDPTQHKTGIFRFFQFKQNVENITTSKGKRIQNVIRLRLLHEGEKIRSNFKFDCVE